MEDKVKSWVEAAKKLSLNSNEVIKCPECGNGRLIVRDEVFESGNKIDRYLICDHCGRWNVITMKNPKRGK